MRAHTHRVFNVPEEVGISLHSFLNVVGQLKFRGTSVLFRLPRSPVVKRVGKRQGQSAIDRHRSTWASEEGKGVSHFCAIKA